MKMTKKAFAVIISLAMILAFAGCGSKQAEEPSATEAPAQETSYEQIGTVVDYDLEIPAVTIVTALGEELTFAGDDTENMAIFTTSEGEDGIDKDDLVIVAYSGAIVDGDTSDTTVTGITILVAEEYEVDGTLEGYDAKTGNMTIKTTEGKTLVLDVSTGVRHYSEGIHKGDKLQVIYTGEINGTDTSACHVRSVISDGKLKVDKKETVTVKAVDETVYSTADMNVRAGSATSTKSVGKVHKGEKLKRTGILSNGWSRISYKGKDCYVMSKFVSKNNPDKKPTTKKPTTTKPTTKPSTTKKPTTTKPTTKPSTTKKPTTTEPEPTTYKPVTEPTTEPEPTTYKPVTEPTTEETTTEPTTEETTTEPTTKDPEEEVHTISGKATDDSTIDSIVIEKDGKEYKVDTSSAKIDITEEGDLAGKTLYIEYKGELNSPIKAISISDCK